MAEISMRAFALLINVSDKAVRQAIKAGKFEHGLDPETGKIDPVEAQKNTWVKQQSVKKKKAGVSQARANEKTNNSASPNKGTAKARPQKAANKQGTATGSEPPDTEEPELNIDTDAFIASINITKEISYSRASQLREIVALALDKKKLQELNGTLISKDDVYKNLYALGTELKKAFMNMPQRVVRKIMTAKTEVEGINILTTEITEILAEFGSLGR